MSARQCQQGASDGQWDKKKTREGQGREGWGARVMRIQNGMRTVMPCPPGCGQMQKGEGGRGAEGGPESAMCTAAPPKGENKNEEGGRKHAGRQRGRAATDAEGQRRDALDVGGGGRAGCNKGREAGATDEGTGGRKATYGMLDAGAGCKGGLGAADGICARERGCGRGGGWWWGEGLPREAQREPRGGRFGRLRRLGRALLLHLNDLGAERQRKASTGRNGSAHDGEDEQRGEEGDAREKAEAGRGGGKVLGVRRADEHCERVTGDGRKTKDNERGDMMKLLYINASRVRGIERRVMTTTRWQFTQEALSRKLVELL
ncbi:hypothetical protein DFH09DRAFT_1455087 [Mycena vulgaris]|nr:hypothetical protein DFH09DRAFT_1455087 [Mycena vulgaris]